MDFGLARRCDALRLDEELVLRALDETYQRGEMEYLFYSPARDVTAARAAALSWQASALRRPRDTDGSPEGPDPEGLDGEAATAGAEGIAQPLPPNSRTHP